METKDGAEVNGSCSALPVLSAPPALGKQAPSLFGKHQPSPFPVSNMMIKVLEINVLTGPRLSQRGAFLSLSFLIWPG